MSFEKFKPSSEEIKKAEGMMTERESGLSEVREKEINVEKIKEEIEKFRETISDKFDAENAAKINSALDLMVDLHSTQEERPDHRPYISHPLEIADDVVNKYEVKKPELVLAALLHDSVEDQSLKLSVKRLERQYGTIGNEAEIKNPEFLKEKFHEELEEIALGEIGFQYGDRVREVVEKLSNPDFDSLIEELKLKGVEKSKNELYKEHVAEAIEDPDVCVIKYADFARNALKLGSIPEGLKKDKLRKKYGPVIQEVFLPVFRSLEGAHPLFGKREEIIKELEAVYKKEYEGKY